MNCRNQLYKRNHNFVSRSLSLKIILYVHVHNGQYKQVSSKLMIDNSLEQLEKYTNMMRFMF